MFLRLDVNQMRGLSWIVDAACTYELGSYWTASREVSPTIYVAGSWLGNGGLAPEHTKYRSIARILLQVWRYDDDDDDKCEV